MGNIITLTPALTITQDEMDQALDIIEKCIADIEK
jgi:4-aminobutyrate aminotransferase-like enzyme